MPIDMVTVAVASPAALSTELLEAAARDERWNGWLAKGAAHDRAVRRKMALAAPLLIAILAVVIYVLFTR